MIIFVVLIQTSNIIINMLLDYKRKIEMWVSQRRKVAKL